MEWIKALHVIAVIAWMAGIFYLPRLFAYHALEVAGSAQSETFKTMERRLLKAIMNPAAIASWVFGLWLILVYSAFDFGAAWSWIKLSGVLVMTGFHGFLIWCQRKFANDTNTLSNRFYRAINELPTLLMIVIVIMIIVRPF